MTGQEMLEKLQAMTPEQLQASVVACEDKVVDITWYGAVTQTWSNGNQFHNPARIYVVQEYER